MAPVDGRQKVEKRIAQVAQGGRLSAREVQGKTRGIGTEITPLGGDKGANHIRGGLSRGAAKVVLEENPKGFGRRRPETGGGFGKQPKAIAGVTQ